MYAEISEFGGSDMDGRTGDGRHSGLVSGVGNRQNAATITKKRVPCRGFKG